MRTLALKNLSFTPLVRTNSTKFVVPLVLKDRALIDRTRYEFFNAYIGDINRPWLEDKVFLVYKTNNNINEVRKKLYTNIYFYSDYWIVINGEYYDVFVFNIPFCYKKDLNIIKDGNVTSLNVSTKKVITDFWGRNEYSIYTSLNRFYINSNNELSVDNDLIKEEDIVPSMMDTMLGIA